MKNLNQQFPQRVYQRRNPVAQAAIMRKGGVHEESCKSKRQKQQRQLREMIIKGDDYVE